MANQPAEEVLTAGPQRRSGRGLAIGIASVAGGLVLGVVAVAGATGAPAEQAIAHAAQAQTSTPSSVPPVPSTPPSAPALKPSVPPGLLPDGPPGHHRGYGSKGRRGGGPKGIGHDVLHGEFVTEKAGGGYETVQMQRGTATAVSATSITVKSADGFTRSYAVNKDTTVIAASDGITSIALNDAVHVRAVGAGDKATASLVADETALKAARGNRGPKAKKEQPDVRPSA